MQKKVIARVDEMGEKVVEDFHKNRILKKEDIHQSENQLYIFDNEEREPR
jgi:hypothetical protein